MTDQSSPGQGHEATEAERPKLSRESLEAALRAGVHAAEELAAKLQDVFELPEDGQGPRFK